MIAVAVLVVFNLIYALPRYLPLDPTKARVPIDPHAPEQFPMIIAHLLTGNLAMVAVFLQLLPWLRKAHPNVHRASGYVYVFGGVLPSAGLGLALLPYHVIPTGQTGLGMMAVLWILVTLQGFRMQRQKRYAEHRRWMIYSFALTLGTTWARVLAYAVMWIPGFTISDFVFLEITSWLGWVTNLILAFLWLDWTARRSARRGLPGAVPSHAG